MSRWTDGLSSYEIADERGELDASYPWDDEREEVCAGAGPTHDRWGERDEAGFCSECRPTPCADCGKTARNADLLGATDNADLCPPCAEIRGAEAPASRIMHEALGLGSGLGCNSFAQCDGCELPCYTHRLLEVSGWRLCSPCYDRAEYCTACDVLVLRGESLTKGRCVACAAVLQ